MKRTVFAALLASGLAAGAAFAQAPDIATGRVPGASGNTVGGGVATLTGSGDDMLITYGRAGAGVGGGAVNEQIGRTGTFAGSDGSKPRWTYTTPTTAPDAGREAWLSGGGDDAQVVYGR